LRVGLDGMMQLVDAVSGDIGVVGTTTKEWHFFFVFMFLLLYFEFFFFFSRLLFPVVDFFSKEKKNEFSYCF